MDHLDDGDLLAAVRSQPEAFGVFYRRYVRSVMGYFMRRTGDPEVADARVADLLDRLPAEQAQAIRSRVIDEEDYADIAGRLHCSQSVIRQRVSRGLGALRTLMEEDA